MFRIEVAVIDLMTARPQSRDNLAVEGCAKAAGDGVGVQNEDSQRRAP
jgi:hypothetical protein